MDANQAVLTEYINELKDIVSEMSGDAALAKAKNKVQSKISSETISQQEQLINELNGRVSSLQSEKETQKEETSSGFTYGDEEQKVSDSTLAEEDQEVVTEETPYNRGQYLQLVVEEAWEGPLDEIQKLGVRIVKCRAGIVLGRGNVATQIFTLISKLNLSGPIGKGDQYFSWISVEDLVSAYIFCLENSNVDGPVNFTAPEPLQQKEFARIIAKIMNKKYFAPPLPPIIMRLAVGWELGEQLGLNSIRAIPKKLLREGFEFQNTTLETMKEEFTK